MTTSSSEYYYTERVNKDDDIIRFSIQLAKRLIDEKFSVAICISMTSESVYLLVDKGVLGVIRVSAHLRKYQVSTYEVIQKLSPNCKKKNHHCLSFDEELFSDIVHYFKSLRGVYESGNLVSKKSAIKNLSSFRAIKRDNKKRVYRVILQGGVSIEV